MAFFSDSGGNLSMIPMGFMAGVLAAWTMRFVWSVLLVPLTLLVAISASRLLFGEGADLSTSLVATILAAALLGAAATVAVLNLRQRRSQTS